MSDHVSWVKGHGTENDFVLLPDPDGHVHGRLEPGLVAALCHRRRGIGADGVLRVIRSQAYDDPSARQAAAAGAEWFMDYRNADGSVSEMCGNGVRVFARYLVHAGLVDGVAPVAIGSRDGVKTARFHADGAISVNMGTARVLDPVTVGVAARQLPAIKVDVGNPHAVAVVGSLAEAGPLLEAPWHDPDAFPDGVNVEFVVRTGARSVAMRVHERGAGETRSCGTGACAVGAAVAVGDGLDLPVDLDVQVTGGDLVVSVRAGDEAGTVGVALTGPAELVAQGTWPLT